MMVRNALQSALDARTSGEAARWIGETARRVAHGDREALLAAYTEASQRLGRLPLAMDRMTGFPPRECAGLSLENWSLEDAARAVFLLGRAETTGAEVFDADARACYDLGDAREQLSWLRGVVLLPAPERFLMLVIDACRTNIQPLFEAIACENPYPSLYFPERNFNQVVMKALFNGVRLERVVGLALRTNGELARMAADFSAERRAAGRPVPADIGLAMAGAAA